MKANARSLYLAVCLIVASDATAQDIHGVVVDSSSQPIENAVVELFPSSRRDGAQRTQTNAKGEYTFKAPKFSAAFDIIYSHSKMDDATVYRLAENKPQEINKVLYKTGEPRNAVAVLDTLQSAERIFVMLMSAPPKSDEHAALAEHLGEGKLQYLARIESIIDKEEPSQARVYVLEKAKFVSDHLKTRR
jgi:hypothetical protein